MRGLILIAVGLALWSYGTRPTPPAVDQPVFLAGARIDGATRRTMERSCGDCHSEATRYPWYSYVAPISLLVNQDVRHGREHLNLSRWERYTAVRRQRALSEIANQVRDGEMPLQQYLWVHSAARLSEAEINAIFQWTQTERRRLILENSK